MKLAPNANTLQPLPANVQPAVSQSVQRTATQADIETIQNVQTTEQTQANQQSGSPVPAFVPVPSGGSVALWIALIIAVLVAGAAVWIWRSF